METIGLGSVLFFEVSLAIYGSTGPRHLLEVPL